MVQFTRYEKDYWPAAWDGRAEGDCRRLPQILGMLTGHGGWRERLATETSSGGETAKNGHGELRADVKVDIKESPLRKSLSVNKE